MRGRTAVVSVKYIDYAVARNLLNVVDDWFESLPKAHVPRFWSFIRKNSGAAPHIARYLAGIAVAAILLATLPNFVPPDATLLQLAKFWLLAFVGLFAAYQLAHHLGRAAENSIDRWSEVAYINLTAGDRKEIQDAERRNRASVWFAGVKFLGALLVSLVAKVIVGLLIG